MTLCINPRCDQPENPDNAQFCQNCQSSLLLKQRYRATKILGGGGFGKTYEAADLGVRNKVIKVLINNSPKAVELFQREAEVLSQLNHPGIPKVEPNSYTVFHPADGQAPVHCLVMEKVEGMNLRDYLKQLRQPIDSETAERWLKELVLILQAVHEQGILHRDIKPQNIIFKPDGSLALIDFGAVREGTGTQVATSAAGGGTEVASHMAAGTTVTSVGYTAPEQMNGHTLRQSDFYSLGRTFVFLLTGKEPSEIPYDAYNDVLQWRQYAPNVNRKLADVLDQMQSTSVKQRLEDAQDVLRRLQLHSSSPFSSSRHPSSPSSGEPVRGDDIEVQLEVSPTDIFTRISKDIMFTRVVYINGKQERKTKTLRVDLSRASLGDRIHFKGQGNEGLNSGSSGDLYVSLISPQSSSSTINSISHPLFLYIPAWQLIFLSVISFGIYESYWIYKNWWYLKERKGLEIQPFWRGLFGIFFIHRLLHRIHKDKDINSTKSSSFSPNLLATCWLFWTIISEWMFGQLEGMGGPGPAIYFSAVFIFSSLCLVPVQNYVNSVTKVQLPREDFYKWSMGQTLCLLLGIVSWILLYMPS